MAYKLLKIEYEEFLSLDELEAADRALAEAAIAAIEGSYAPYSNFNVGAAVRLEDCRQVMAEFQTESGSAMSVLLVGAAKIWKFPSVEALLPFIFDSL